MNRFRRVLAWPIPELQPQLLLLVLIAPTV